MPVSVNVSPEQEELRQLARKFLADEAARRDRRPLPPQEPYHGQRTWRQLADIGLAGIAVPEQYGGAGQGPAELGIVLEEMGRALYAGPYFATCALAAQALVCCTDEAARERWLPAIAAGDLTATLAVAGPEGHWALEAPGTVAEPSGGQWAVTGTKMYVIDGEVAGLILVTAQCSDGPALFAVQAPASGLTRTPLDTLDLTRHLARLDFENVPAIRVDAGDVPAWFGHLRDLVRSALAAEQAGGAAGCLDMAVAYARMREQFGRPVASFQAIKHKCADLLVEVESARSAARFAGLAAAVPGPEASVAAAVAGSWCSAAFTRAARENIQIHGGIGFTWEHEAHLYLRRAKSSELLFGSPQEERLRLADLVGI